MKKVLTNLSLSDSFRLTAIALLIVAAWTRPIPKIESALHQFLADYREQEHIFIASNACDRIFHFDHSSSEYKEYLQCYKALGNRAAEELERIDA